MTFLRGSIPPKTTGSFLYIPQNLSERSNLSIYYTVCECPIHCIIIRVRVNYKYECSLIAMIAIPFRS